jgi:hypothetical protein
VLVQEEVLRGMEARDVKLLKVRRKRSSISKTKCSRSGWRACNVVFEKFLSTKNLNVVITFTFTLHKRTNTKSKTKIR